MSRAKSYQRARPIGGVAGVSVTMMMGCFFFSPHWMKEVAPAWFLIGSRQVATISGITAATCWTNASANLITPQIMR